MAENSELFISPTNSNHVGFEVLKAVGIMCFIFWGTVARSLLKIKQRFGETLCFRLQDRRISQARKHENM
jgi:hypothetical protein